MDKQGKILQFENYSKGVAAGSIKLAVWQDLARKELFDFNANVPDSLNQNELTAIFNKFNFHSIRVSANLTAFMEHQGGLTTPMLDGFRGKIIFSNNDTCDTIVGLGENVLYGGDNCSVSLQLLAPVRIFKGQEFALIFNNQQIGRGLLI
jgi:hypothetical protein